MLNCEICDYLKKLTVCSDKGIEMAVFKCEYADFTFPKPPDELDIEYPCNTIDFMEENNESKQVVE